MKNPVVQRLVRISRIDGLEALICCVHASSNDCIVLSEQSESLDLDGFCLIPTKSVRCFDHEFEKVEFYQAALQAWPNSTSHVELLSQISCNLISDMRLLMNRKETIAVHTETDDPEVCYVGTVRDVTESEVFLDRITSSGERVVDALGFEIALITKVEIATRYLISVAWAADVLEKK